MRRPLRPSLNPGWLHERRWHSRRSGWPPPNNAATADEHSAERQRGDDDACNGPRDLSAEIESAEVKGAQRKEDGFSVLR